jgi:hypothetical protein
MQWPVQGTKAGQASIQGSTPAGLFGAGLAVGDVNGDGADDLIAGAPFVGKTTWAAGEAYVIPGPLALGRSYTMPQAAALLFKGADGPEPQIGHYLESGDMNGDGYDEIVLGSWISGTAYVYLGSPSIQGHSPMTVPVTSENMALTTNGAGYGLVLCDLNDDGYQDLFLENNLSDHTQVWGILGSAALTTGHSIRLPTAADMDIVIHAEQPTILSKPAYNHMACGDVDGDRHPDLAFGVPGMSLADRPGAGIVYAVRGDPSITHGTPVTLTLPEQAGAVIEGIDGRPGANGDGLGTSLALADVNQDQRADLIVGAPGASGPDNLLQRAGEVYLWLGRTLEGQRFSISSQASWTVHGADADELLGSAIATGDYDGDGAPEILLGCKHCAPQGAPYWYSGRGFMLEPLEISDTVTVTAVSKLDLIPYPDARGIGYAVSAIDLDDDGIRELAIGAPYPDMLGENLPGTVYLIAYPGRNQAFLPVVYR